MSRYQNIQIGPRAGALLLVLLISFFLAWDLRAIALDNRVGPNDTVVQDAVLYSPPTSGSEKPWIFTTTKGIFLGPAAYYLTQITGQPIRTARFLSVLLHGLLLWMIYTLTLRLTSRRGDGLLATAVCGVFPALYGWFRLDYQEPLVAVFVLLSLWQMITWRPTWRRGVLLGLALGLGLLSKPAFPIYVLGPLLVFVALRLRTRRDLAMISLAAATTLAVAGWWWLGSYPAMISLVTQSRQLQESTEIKVIFYLELFTGSWQYLLGAAVGLVLARLWLRLDLGPLALLAACLASTWLLLFNFFDPWCRYLVPALPVTGLLAALGIISLVRWLAQKAGPAAAALLAAVGVAGGLWVFVQFNLNWPPDHPTAREESGGMIAPDRRIYGAYGRIIAAVKKQGEPSLTLLRYPPFSHNDAVPWIYRQRGQVLPIIGAAQARTRMANHGSALLVLAHRGRDPDEALARVPDSQATEPDLLALVRASRATVLVSHGNPDGVRYTLFRLQPANPGAGRKAPPPG